MSKTIWIKYNINTEMEPFLIWDLDFNNFVDNNNNNIENKLENEENYEVEEVKDHKIIKNEKGVNKYIYLIKWKGYSNEENTWENIETFDEKDLIIINKYMKLINDDDNTESDYENLELINKKSNNNDELNIIKNNDESNIIKNNDESKIINNKYEINNKDEREKSYDTDESEESYDTDELEESDDIYEFINEYNINKIEEEEEKSKIDKEKLVHEEENKKKIISEENIYDQSIGIKRKNNNTEDKEEKKVKLIPKFIPFKLVNKNKK